MASRFWVGGTGNWDASTTTNWSATTGGAGGASVPTSADDVTFDVNSGTAATVTITAAANANSITINKSDLTLLHNAGSTVVGTVALTTGTLNTNGQTCVWGALAASGTSTKTITLGTSSITCNSAAGTPWSIVATGTTLSATSSTITISGTSRGFTSGSGALNYGSLVLNGAGTQAVTVSSGTTFVNLTRTGTAVTTDALSIGASIVVSGTLTVSGNSASNRLLVTSSSVGTAITITAASVTAANVDFQDITGGGSANWNLSGITGGAGNCGGTSGITFTTPVDQHWLTAAGGNWSDVTNWTSRVPLPQDNVFFDIAFASAVNVVTDMPRLGASIDWSGATWTGTAVTMKGGSSITSYIFGGLTLAASMTTLSVIGNAWILAGRVGTFSLMPNGVSIGPPLTIAAPTGTYNLGSAYLQGNSFSMSAGTYNTNGYTVTASVHFILTAGTVNLGTSTIVFDAVGGGGGFTVNTGVVLDASQATIKITTAYTGTRTFSGGSHYYNTLTYTKAGSTGPLVIAGSNTFGTINFSDTTNARTLQFTAGTVNTITTRNIVGTAGKLMSVTSTAAGTPAVLVSRNVWLMGANSVNVSGNSGLTFAGGAEMDYLSVQDITGSQAGSTNFFRLLS